jgi:predicted acyltransferase (DUF342 family)
MVVMPTPAQFFRYCPSEAAALGASTSSEFGTFVVNGGPAQSRLDRYLAVDGRAAETKGLSTGSYLADPASQPLHRLSADMEASYAAIGGASLPGLAGFFDFRSYVSLSIPSVAGERTATAGTSGILRHVAAGSEVLVQIPGDSVGEIAMTVASVAPPTIELSDDAGRLPRDAEVFLTALKVSDVERAAAVVEFRQFERFDALAVAADEETFNPALYLLLYRAIDPDILGMTASQMYDDYSGQPGRVGSVADLRRALDQPTVGTLRIAELLELEDGAALKLDGVLVRAVTTSADMAAGNGESRSDVSLMTAAAARELVSTAIANLQQVATSQVITATEEINLPGSIHADLSEVLIAVPLDVFSVRTTELRADGATALSLRANALFADKSTLGEASCSSLAAGAASVQSLAAAELQGSAAAFDEVDVRGSVAAGDVLCRGALVAGDSLLASLETSDIRATGSARLGGDLSCGNVTSSGSATYAGDLQAAAIHAADGIDAASGSFVVTGSSASLRVPLSAADVSATRVAASQARFDSIVASDVDAEHAAADVLTASRADVGTLRVSAVREGLRVFGPTRAEDLACAKIVGDSVETEDARHRQITATTSADLFSVSVRRDLACERTVSAHRVVAAEMDVTEHAAFDTVAVTGPLTARNVNVKLGLAVAGDVLVAGAIDAGSTRVRGKMELQGDLAAQRVVVEKDLFVEYGDIKVTRGSADVRGDANVGGSAAFGADISVGGGGAFGGGGVRTSGSVIAVGDVAATNAAFSGELKAGDARLGRVQCSDVRCGGVAVDGSARVGGDVSADGDVLVEGAIVCKSTTTTAELQTFGDIEAGHNVTVANKVIVGDDLDVAGNARVSGDAVLHGSLKCDALAAGDVVAAGVACSGDVSTECDLYAGGGLAVGGVARLGDDLEVAGAVVGESLEAKSDVAAGGDMTVAGDGSVSGNARVGGYLDVSGALSVGGALLCEDSLECGDLRAGDARVGDLGAADVTAESVTAGFMVAGCLQAGPSYVTATGPIESAGLKVTGAVSMSGPVEFDGVLDFGTQPTSFRSSVAAPSVTCDAMSAQQLRVAKIVISPSEDAPPPPSQALGLEARLADVEARLARLADLLSLPDL